MSPSRRQPRPVVVTPVAPPAAIVEAGTLSFPLSPSQTEQIVRNALNEDGAEEDITTIVTIVGIRRGHGSLVARAKGVIAGVPLAVAAFRVMDPKMTARVDVPDGASVQAGSTVLFVSGRARALLSAERVALNFMQRLSGIATLTRHFVDAVAGTGARILDTRKTTPGLRVLEKYAVRAGGGFNHRMSLADSVLIKDNHLVALSGNLEKAVSNARQYTARFVRVEVECDSADQVKRALDAGADVVLLDNMNLRTLAACVKAAKGKAITEASGGVNLSNVRAIAECGVDWISVGALTHSAPALDLALDFDPV
jgi:nicotinate-nucleotide pyrophosphorylase (carboxylating)